MLLACCAMAPASAGAQAASASSNKPAPAPPSTIVYHNKQYGFCFVLPASWKGFTVVTEQWRGTVFSSGQVVHGPQLLIRNPKWTKERPYQDIPIMVFTPAQWQQVVAVTMSVSAAPIGPAKMGQNSRYVFALPPRWIGFTDALGQDEVNAWMEQNRLQAPCGNKPTQPVKGFP
jgi:hypothetical protein